MAAVQSMVAGSAAPAWLSEEMPPGYANRLAEIQRLSAELQEMERFGRLLWQAGDALSDAVQEAFAAMGMDAEIIPGSPVASVRVRFDTDRRLLFTPAAN